MPFWALLGCFLHPFCGEGRADCVWKGHVWGWKCYCFKGEKTKEWKNEDPLFNAQTSCSILLKSQFLSSTLGVLSSKRLTFQAQMLDVLSPKSPTFQVQTLDVLSSKSPTFQVQTLDVLSLKSLTFKAQHLMFYLLKVQRFKFKHLVFYLSRVQVFKPKSPSFQAQKPRFQVLNLAVWPYFVYSFALLCLLFCSFFF